MVYKVVRPVVDLCRIPDEHDSFISPLADKDEWRVLYRIGHKSTPNPGQMPLFAFNTAGNASAWLGELNIFDCMIFEAEEERTTCDYLKNKVVLPYNMTPIFCSSIKLVRYLIRKHKE